jgi:hypothetical protein
MPGFPRVIWSVYPSRLATVILLDDGTLEETRRCTHSVFDKSTYENIEMIIVTNKEAFQDFELGDQRVRVVNTSEPLDFPSANNLGAAQAHGEVLVFLDRRIEILSSDWLQEMIGWCSQPKIGVTGPQLISEGMIIHGEIVRAS